MSFQAKYRQVQANQKFEQRITAAQNLLAACELCPRTCGVNRLNDELGYCGAGKRLTVSSYGPHFGEETPLVGSGGSGTVFFTYCNLGCVFCQNYSLSHYHEGAVVTPQQLAQIMMDLQAKGCPNINLVTPTHYMPQILEAVALAAKLGLTLPLVYNCGGYESMAAVRTLNGIVDIYMPDVKFFNPEAATIYADAPDYPAVVQEVLVEMHRQVGDLKFDQRGLATTGLLIRHLVMPGLVDDSIAILDFIARELGPDSYVNVMAQYRPMLNAHKFPAIARSLTAAEYQTVVDHAKTLGLVRGLEHHSLGDDL